jgi:ABC-type uncharacterized transport system substrate-binding protein
MQVAIATNPRNPPQIPSARDADIAALAPDGKTLLVFGEGMPFVSRRALLSYLAGRDRIPAIHAYRAAAEEGSLASFGARLADGGYQMGLCAAHVLRGARSDEVID